MLDPFDVTQRSHSSIELYNFHEDEDFVQATRRFQDNKRNFLLKNASADEDEWRSAIKQQLEEELDRRVREALETPPPPSTRDGGEQDGVALATIRERQRQLEVEFGERLKVKNMTPRERAYLQSKQWQILQAKRKMRRLMASQAPAATATRGQEYVMSSDLFSHGSGARTGPTDRADSPTLSFSHVSGNVKCHQHYVLITQKGERDLGSLSTVERYEFFYGFTKSGFREAMRLGCLPDGSELKPVDRGKFKDKYGIVRDEHGPYWPADCGPLFPPPSFVRSLPAKAEPVLENINEKYRQTVETQRHSFNHKWRGVNIIYDSEKCGRLYEPSPVSEGNAPSLVFESRFESGNLRQARRIGQFEYELVLKTDLYTQRHTQWYYFRLSGALPGITYKFKIVNLLKKTSLYNHGMRPLLYSERDARARRQGWAREGHHIAYYRNEHNLQCPLLPRDRTHYVLEWQMEFPNAEDTYYLAHCYPYTYTDLKDDLDRLLGDPLRAKVMKREVMCETRAGNSCFLITVTNFNSGGQELGDAMQQKRGIVVTARVHPGETNSSWMMKGLLDYVTGPSHTAQELREKFIFKIVPMLNPDGVIVGNYRCSLAARDLNRNYRHPRKESFPTVWHTKDMLEHLIHNTKQVMIYCDLHGHSRKQNVFMYGCNTDAKAAGQSLTLTNPTHTFLRERVFPWLMAMKAPDKFSFRGCKFAVRKCKEATGRVVMFRQMRISNSFTMEATFCGTNICRGDRRHFNLADFEHMGQAFCEVALEYHQMQNDRKREVEVLVEISRAVAQQVLESRCLLPTDLPNPTTEKGRLQLQGTESSLPAAVNLPALQTGEKLSTSEQYAQALLKLLRERDTLSTDSQSKQPNGDALGGMSIDALMGLLAGNSVDRCVQALQQLKYDQDEIDSNSSSDSDSESEPEMAYVEPKPRRKKHKKKKKAASETASAPQERKKQKGQGRSGKESTTQEDQRPKSISFLPPLKEKFRSTQPQCDFEQDIGKKMQTSTTATRITAKQVAKNYPGFVNKYVGRTNGGIPCFSEERLLERAAKRMEEMKKRLEEEQRDRLYFGTAENEAYGVPREYVMPPPPGVGGRGGLSTYELHRQFTQAYDRGMHIRTGYMHGAESPGTPNRRSSASSDEESEDESPGNPRLHPVTAVHSPYSQHPPTLAGLNGAGGGGGGVGLGFTAQFQQQLGLNAMPVRTSRSETDSHQSHRHLLLKSLVKAKMMRRKRQAWLPPLSNAFKRNHTMLSAPTPIFTTDKSLPNRQPPNPFTSLSVSTRNMAPLHTYRDPGDNSSIPQRHNNASGMGQVATPRGVTLSVNGGGLGAGGEAQHRGGWGGAGPGNSAANGAATAAIINHGVPTDSVHRNKSYVSFPKIHTNQVSALPAVRPLRRQGERHATCE